MANLSNKYILFVNAKKHFLKKKASFSSAEEVIKNKLT